VSERPWRAVVYIGTQAGELGGFAWRLVLECGHAEYRKQPPFRFFRSVEERLAPKRVVCTSCTFGHPTLDVDNAIKLAQAIDDTCDT
jgi:hypothetical protein